MGPPPRGGGGSDVVVATRADVRRSCSGGSSPSLCAEGGSCTEQRSTEPEDRQSKWEAPWRPAGARGAGRGSHGRLRGCPGAVPLLSDAGGRCGRGSGRPEERKEWEMELARRDELQRGVTEALEKARVALEPSRGSKRKRKKRRKRRLPRSSVPRGGRPHRRQRQWLVFGSLGDVLHCAVFPSFVDRPEMPCIMAGLDQKDRCSGMYKAGFAGYDTPRAVFPSIVNAHGDSTGAVLGQGDMPLVILSGGFGQTVQKTADSPQLQSIAGRQHPLRAANADPHGPVCSADHGDSTVAAYFGGRCPCCVGSCKSSGAAVEKPLALPQLQLVEKSVAFSDPLFLTVTCSVFVFAFGEQVYGFSGR